MQPPPGRLAPTAPWLKCSRMHVRYFDDNVVFFRIESIRSPGPGCGSGFLISLTHRLAKRNVKTTSPPRLSSKALGSRLN